MSLVQPAHHVQRQSFGRDTREFFGHVCLPPRSSGPQLANDALRQANGDQLFRVQRNGSQSPSGRAWGNLGWPRVGNLK